jgi:hypothetical protein
MKRHAFGLCLLALAGCAPSTSSRAADAPSPQLAEPPAATAEPSARASAAPAASFSPYVAPGSEAASVGDEVFESAEEAEPSAPPAQERPAMPPVPARRKPRANCDCRPGDLICALKCSDPAGSDGRTSQATPARPFDRQAAITALRAAGKGARDCAGPGGPTGSGRVALTFGPSGRVATAVVSGASFAGTPTGACVAARFRSVRVPPFEGTPVRVSMSFAIP